MYTTGNRKVHHPLSSKAAASGQAWEPDAEEEEIEKLGQPVQTGTKADKIPAEPVQDELPSPPPSDAIDETLEERNAREAKVVRDGLPAALADYGEKLIGLGTPSGEVRGPLRAEEIDAMVADLRACAEGHGGVLTIIKRKPVAGTQGGECVDVLVRTLPATRLPVETRLAIIGNVDSGKSTMVGVLTRSVLDDGRGGARSRVFNHHHEASTGRTSSISQHNLCLDASNQVLNDANFKDATCPTYVERAAKIVTLVDLAGHEKYFRTTAYGMTGHLPDYACVVVGANAGMVGMCKEHLGIALALRVPVFFVVTKVDLCPAHILKDTLHGLASVLRKPRVRRRAFAVRSHDDVLTALAGMNGDGEQLAPVFRTSAVTGEGLDLLRAFVGLLPPRVDWAARATEPAEFVVDETFGVPGVGTVVAGTLKRGVIEAGAKLLLGPDAGDGGFHPVAVRSIHYKRMPVGKVMAGQTAALALKKVKRSAVRKGMVLTDESLAPRATWEFDADIAVLTHSTTIQPRYQAVVHCEIVRAAARVIAMDQERLRSGDRAVVRFRFLQRPEYVPCGARFVFREGHTKGIGMIISTGGS